MLFTKCVTNGAVLLGSVLLGLLLCEGASRLFLNPADYLSLTMLRDDILGAVPSVPPGRRGIDKWGFRNAAVPDAADIVAIGDSHTYGNTAVMEDSWPAVVGKATHKTVYNMGLGGYGPNQYLHLLRTRALLLKPRLVVCGLYMGDDFENAFSITYGLPHWAYLRHTGFTQVDFDIWGTAVAPPSWHKRIRIWLSQNSVAYQLVFHASPLGRLLGEFQIRNAAKLNSSATTIDSPKDQILEAFLPGAMLRRLDQHNEAVREGMRITFTLLRDMNDICHRNGVQFAVVLIPAKEMVFSEYLDNGRQIPLHDVMNAVVENGEVARVRTLQFLNESGIPVIDALPVLKSSVGQKLYARTATDMHPGGNGYRVIGEAVSHALQHSLYSAARSADSTVSSNADR